MFGIDSQEEMPQSFITDPDAWDQFMGHIWHGVLQAVGPSQDATIIEIAPGSSAKIGYALNFYGFKGKLYIVDCTKEALQTLEPKYRQLLPEAEIHFICATLKTTYLNLPRHPALFMGNHIFDDMLLGEADEEFSRENTFKWSNKYSAHVSNEVFDAWSYISNHPSILERKKNDVVQGINETLAYIQPQSSVFNQYPSSALHAAGITDLNQTALDIQDRLAKTHEAETWPQDKIQTILSSNKHYNNAHIGMNVLNARHWLICNR